MGGKDTHLKTSLIPPAPTSTVYSAGRIRYFSDGCRIHALEI